MFISQMQELKWESALTLLHLQILSSKYSDVGGEKPRWENEILREINSVG